jgi:hypothetical protein
MVQIHLQNTLSTDSKSPHSQQTKSPQELSSKTIPIHTPVISASTSTETEQSSHLTVTLEPLYTTPIPQASQPVQITLLTANAALPPTKPTQRKKPPEETRTLPAIPGSQIELPGGAGHRASPAPQPGSKSRKKKPKKDQTIFNRDDWENKTIEGVFLVTLNVCQT